MCSYCEGQNAEFCDVSLPPKKKFARVKQPISVTHPHLLDEWDWEYNNLMGLDPYKLTYGSHVEAGWVCKLDSRHLWKATIKNRTLNNTNCRFCCNQEIFYENSIVFTHPDLAKEFDVSKNNISIFSVSFGSTKEVWWACCNGHSWVESPNRRTAKGLVNSCRICRSLGFLYPELGKQWDYEKNKDTPFDVSFGSEQLAWWLCEKGHSWRARICGRTLNGNGCKYCSNQKAGYGNDLLTKFPKLCEEWHHTKNTLGPENYLPKSNKKIWWLCKVCGHKWPATIANRVNGSGCPHCSGSSISKASQKWLDSISIENREVKIPELKFRVDGFDPETNTIYEFLGDYWHGGCRKDLVGVNKTSKVSFHELNNQTFTRFEKLKAAGYKIFYIWENDYKNENIEGKYE